MSPLPTRLNRQVAEKHQLHVGELVREGDEDMYASSSGVMKSA